LKTLELAQPPKMLNVQTYIYLTQKITSNT